MYDLIVIGSGAAGMTAAIYTRRKQLSTLVITIEVGGQTLMATELENYPGFTEKLGSKLMKTMESQVKALGAEFVFGRVQGIEKKGRCFTVRTFDNKEFSTKTIILALGKVPKKLGIEGEDEFYGKGVSVCATCDAPLFAGKQVAVIGGGNSSVDSAELLAKFADKVYIIHRRDQYRADEAAIARLKKNKKIEEVLKHIPIKIDGNKFVSSLIVKDVGTEKQKDLSVSGVFIEVGYKVETEFLKHLVKLNGRGEIIIDNEGKTSCEGIFAAGDVTDIPYKQTIIAAGMGATAGLSAYAYLQDKEGKVVSKTDWCEV